MFYYERGDTISLARFKLSLLFDSTFDRSCAQAAYDAALKNQREQYQGDGGEGGSRGNLAPGHGVFSGKERNAHRQCLNLRVGHDDKREEKLVPRMDKNQ